VSKLVVLKPLGLALSEKQIPQIIENTKKCGELKEPLEPDGMRPRQVRYQAALRPDILCFFDFKPLPEFAILSRVRDIKMTHGEFSFSCGM